MTSVFARQPAAPLTKTLREREAERFRDVLAAVLTAGLEDALAAGDHPRAVGLINRGFAEGSPQLGCDLLCRAIAVVGAARTWTVQIAPLAHVPERRTATVPPAGLSRAATMVAATAG